MRKSFIATVFLLIMSVCVTGCGAVPSLTEEQSGVVTEYATSLLLKYDTQEHSRLIDYEDFFEKYDKAWDEYNEAKAKYEKQLAREEKKKKQEEAETVVETTVVDKSESSSSANGGASIIDTMTIGQFIGEQYDFNYSGYSLVKSYPADGTDFFFSMDATKGHDLLIVKFTASNILGEDSDLDVMNKNLTFKLSINGEGYHSSYKTMLDDDFSEFVGSFKAGESKELVLIGEVEEGKAINSIDLRISDTKGNVITKQLLK